MNLYGSRIPLRSLALAAWLVFAVPPSAHGQQFVVDDVAIVDFRACQLEVWHGEVSSWILPACQLVRNLEIAAGGGFLRGNGARRAEYEVQAKYVFVPAAAHRIGMGLVAGLGLGTFSQMRRDGIAGVFAYVPVTVIVGDGRLALHANLGGHYEGDHADHHDHGEGDHGHDHHGAGGHYELTWGGRADVLLPLAGDRFTVIGELFGEDRDRPEFQLGVRTEVVAERLLIDVSWGGTTAAGERGAGWTIGAAWTPPSFF